jgi:predicted outer membrane protein
MRALILLASAFALSGCIAKTAVDLVTLPVRAGVAVVGAGVDAVTTSQAEADRERGRRLREEDERRGREARQAERQAAKERAREQAREREEDEPN